MAATRKWGVLQFPIHLGVRISPEDREKLRRLVAQHGGDQSSVVRGLLRAARLKEDGDEERQARKVKGVTTPS